MFLVKTYPRWKKKKRSRFPVTSNKGKSDPEADRPNLAGVQTQNWPLVPSRRDDVPGTASTDIDREPDLKGNNL